ncbi:hypothetical protein O181_092982 [Austropuccinia psidii MF-1]|uniref:Uncharacterized protein n=1 Tax=Austropuccinia psidii MF-1 TaxID=1389203 RepID=A0A9Q3PA39_9BASI|nr:hypothetical protein [Austropuccinia psidii MF-1]
MKLNQITSDNTRQTELSKELTQTEDNHKTNVINSIQSLQHNFRNSQRCNNSKMNDIDKLLHTLPRMSTPLNWKEGTRISNPQVLEVENSQLKNEFSTSFHNLKPSMGQALLKEVPKLKEWPHFNGEGEYDHMEFIRGINMIKEDFELPERLANDAWRFKVETALEFAKFNTDKDKALPWFCQQKGILTALYPDMSEFMINRKILKQCEGDLEHAVKSRTAEQSSAEDIINILEEVTTRTRICSSRVNLKTRFNTPWRDSVDKNTKGNSKNVNLHLTDSKENELSSLLYDPKEAFSSDKEPLGEIIGHEADIILNIERPYQPLLRRPAYPASPKSKEALEIHIKELLDLGVIRKTSYNENVEITTPVIVAWHNERPRMVGDLEL